MTSAMTNFRLFAKPMLAASNHQIGQMVILEETFLIAKFSEKVSLFLSFDRLSIDWHNLNDDWSEHHCVRAFAGNVGWHEAEHSCNGYGAHLVSMHNEAYNSRVRSFASNKVGDNQIWTGLTKNGAGGYQWTDGSAVTYTNWRGSPSESVDDECTELWRDNYWQLAKCKETRPYVCKRRRPQEYCWGQTGRKD